MRLASEKYFKQLAAVERDLSKRSYSDLAENGYGLVALFSQIKREEVLKWEIC